MKQNKLSDEIIAQADKARCTSSKLEIKSIERVIQVLEERMEQRLDAFQVSQGLDKMQLQEYRVKLDKLCRQRLKELDEAH